MSHPLKAQVPEIAQPFTSATNTIVKNLIKLVMAGVLIGTLHTHDAWVALILSVYAILTLGRKYVGASDDRHVYLTGFLISSFFGVLCELWGIYFDHWVYHDLPDSREFPFWLPLAWGLAFTYIYKMEKQLVIGLQINGLSGKILLALLVAMIFPTIGEIVTIYLGVWTYHWPYQILGVPLLAIFLLMVFHSGVNLLMGIICKKMNWKDPVFYP